MHSIASEPLRRPEAVTSNPDALPVRHALQAWTIDGVLGHGALGITYRATNAADGRLVAIREYFPASHATRDADGAIRPRSDSAVARFRSGLERFVAEARGLTAVRHPGVVRGLQRFQDNATEYLVTEYVDGELLRTWLAGARPRTGSSLARFAARLLDAVGALHGAGLQHHAITPESIRVGPDGLPVLLDLGASRRVRLDGPEDASAVAAAGYSPIELYGTVGHAGPWSDVYAVAAVLYLIAAGRRPVAAPARTSFDGMRRAEDAPERDRYGVGLLRAIDRALTMDAAARPQSIAAFRTALLAEHPEFHAAVVAAPAVAAAKPPVAAGSAPTGAPVPDAPNAPVYFDPGQLEQIRALLARHLGPVATNLVQQVAARAPDVDALVAELGALVLDDGPRVRFTLDAGALTARWKPQRPETRIVVFDARVLADMEGLLARHLGPIAAVLVKRAARNARDFEALIAQLGDCVADPAARPRFETDARALFGAPVKVRTPGTVSARAAPVAAHASTGENSGAPRFAIDELAAIERDFARHIGPLAKLLVRDAARRARDRTELFLLLAEQIKDPETRKAFTRQGMQAYRRPGAG